MDWIRKLKNICKYPRRDDKAKSFWISTKKMNELFFTGNPITTNSRKDYLDTVKIDVIGWSETVDIKTMLKEKYQKLKYGDVVIIEPLIHCFNYGIFIYDKFRLLPLKQMKDCVNIPEEFQCIINFPIEYWDDLYFISEQIPFDVSQNLPKLSLQDIRLISVSCDSGYICFTIQDNEYDDIHFCVWPKLVTNKTLDREYKTFFESFKKKKYLTRYDENFIHLPPYLSNKKVLIC